MIGIKAKIFNEILKNDLYLGHNKKLLSPSTIPYLYGIKRNKTIFRFKEITLALRVIYIYIANILIFDCPKITTRVLLFYSNHFVFEDIIKNSAFLCLQPFIVDYWVGGTITSKGLKQTKKLRQYNFQLDYIPCMLFIVNLKGLSTILNALLKFNIPIIGIVDSNTSPFVVSYPIFGNSNSVHSIYFFSNFLSKTIRIFLPKLFLSLKKNIFEGFLKERTTYKT